MFSAPTDSLAKFLAVGSLIAVVAGAGLYLRADRALFVAAVQLKQASADLKMQADVVEALSAELEKKASHLESAALEREGGSKWLARLAQLRSDMEVTRSNLNNASQQMQMKRALIEARESEMRYEEDLHARYRVLVVLLTVICAPISGFGFWWWAKNERKNAH